MKLLIKILAFIPLILEVLMSLFLFPEIGKVVWEVNIIFITLLALIGSGLVSKNKILQRIGVGALIILTASLCIIGYYDYIQWLSSIVGIVIFVYFAIIGIIRRKVEKRKI